MENFQLFTHSSCCLFLVYWELSFDYKSTSPPPALVASLGGQGLLWYLRPRIQSICVNLYPSKPSAADDNLCTNILRDSLDPGALAVMISGSKLPPPRTANELLGASFGSSSGTTIRKGSENDTVRVIEGQWSGPVLIAQGMKDPLNDAVGRAKMFQSLRQGIEIAPLDGGHCPHVSFMNIHPCRSSVSLKPSQESSEFLHHCTASLFVYPAFSPYRTNFLKKLQMLFVTG